MQDKTLFLHVGNGRTGSTSIQNCMARNFERLLLREVFYPRPRDTNVIGTGINNSGNGGALLRHLQPAYRHVYFDDEHFVRKFAGLLDSAPPTIVFSNEMMQFAEESLLESLVAFCARYNTTVRPIYVARDWLDHAYSTWRHLVVKERLSLSWENFLLDVYPGWAADMYVTLRKFRSIFGEHLVMLRYSADIAADFFNAIGVAYDELEPAQIENQSVSVLDPERNDSASAGNGAAIVSIDVFLSFLERAQAPIAAVNAEFFRDGGLKLACASQIACAPASQRA